MKVMLVGGTARDWAASSQGLWGAVLALPDEAQPPWEVGTGDPRGSLLAACHGAGGWQSQPDSSSGLIMPYNQAPTQISAPPCADGETEARDRGCCTVSL